MTGGPAMAWACPDGRERPRGGMPDARALENRERPRGGLPDARALEIKAKEAVK
jgi:hypothetical protein